MHVFSRNTLLSTFLMVLPFMLYGWTSRLHPRSHAPAPGCVGGASGSSRAPPNGATAKWALLAPAPALAALSSATSAAPSSSSSLSHQVYNPGPPPPPRVPGFSLPPIATLARWAEEGDPMPELRGTCWMMRSLGPKPKDAGPEYPDYLYEACWGDRIKQVPHPYTENRVVMGAFEGWRKAPEGSGAAGARYAQFYSEGTLCEGWGRRETLVNFFCAEDAVDSPRIMEVVEGEVCKYTMRVETAAACS